MVATVTGVGDGDGEGVGVGVGVGVGDEVGPPRASAKAGDEVRVPATSNIAAVITKHL